MSTNSPMKNRRQFLSQTSFALASVGVVGVPRSGMLDAQSPAVPAKGKAVVQRTLGRTGIKLPIVSMGVMNANNPELLKQAYEAGVRLFDTALGYQQGRNERMVGDVVSQLGVRDKVIIQTKIPFPRVPAGEIKARFLSDFAGCLERLQTKYVDILLIHQPSVEQMNNPEVVAALKEVKQQKTARFIGVSQHAGQPGTLNNAAETGIYDVVLVGFNVTNAGDASFLAALKAASAKGVGVIAMKTQTGGRARNLGALNQTAMLKWALQHPEIATAVPGFTNSDQLSESFSVAYGLDYTPEEKTWLADVSEGRGYPHAHAHAHVCRELRQLRTGARHVRGDPGRGQPPELCGLCPVLGALREQRPDQREDCGPEDDLRLGDCSRTEQSSAKGTPISRAT